MKKIISPSVAVLLCFLLTGCSFLEAGQETIWNMIQDAFSEYNGEVLPMDGSDGETLPSVDPNKERLPFGTTVSMGLCNGICVLSDGNVISTGLHYDKEVPRRWTDIVSVSAGYHHQAALRSDGTVVAAGEADYGQCDVADWTDIVAVSAGASFTLGLQSDGTVVATGRNNYGECDVEGWTDIIAVSADVCHSVGLRADGTVVATGLRDEGRCDVEEWTEIVAISAGMSFTAGLRSDGTVVLAGDVRRLQAGVAEWTDIVAISAGGNHLLGLRSDGTVVAATNARGRDTSEEGPATTAPTTAPQLSVEVAVPHDDAPHDEHLKVSEWTDIVAIEAGSSISVGLRADGTLLVAGEMREYWEEEVASWSGIAVPER